jgi:hypothetical protein
MNQWTPDEVDAHVQFMRDFAARLEETGKFLDAARADTSRRRREVRIEGEPMPSPGEAVDDTLQLYFLCDYRKRNRLRDSVSRCHRRTRRPTVPDAPIPRRPARNIAR